MAQGLEEKAPLAYNRFRRGSKHGGKRRPNDGALLRKVRSLDHRSSGTRPSFREGPDLVIMPMNTADVRSKQEPRFLDLLPLLEPCGHDNC